MKFFRNENSHNLQNHAELKQFRCGASRTRRRFLDRTCARRSPLTLPNGALAKSGVRIHVLINEGWQSPRGRWRQTKEHRLPACVLFVTSISPCRRGIHAGRVMLLFRSHPGARRRPGQTQTGSLCLQFGHLEKATLGQFHDFSLFDIFRWPRGSARCSDFRKWSHYTFRGVS